MVPIVVIIMLANFVDFGSKTGAGSDGMSAEAVAKRIHPVGSIVLKDASAPVVLAVDAVDKAVRGRRAARPAGGLVVPGSEGNGTWHSPVALR